LDKNIEQYSASSHLANNLDFYFLFNNKELLGASSGLKGLDRVIEGWFGLCGLTGEPGKGKTTLAVQTVIYNALILNKPVLYISLEVNKDMLIGKLISHLTKVPIKKILKGGLSFEESMRYFQALKIILKCKNLIILDTKDASFESVENSIYALKEDYISNYEEEEEVLVVLDYLQLFSEMPLDAPKNLDSQSRTPYQMSEFIRIKNESKSNWIVILTKNKASYGATGMGIIKGDNSLEYGFETLITLEDPDDDFPRSDYPENESGFKEVNVVGYCFKNRWGENKKVIPFYFNGAEGTFYEP